MTGRPSSEHPLGSGVIPGPGRKISQSIPTQPSAIGTYLAEHFAKDKRVGASGNSGFSSVFIHTPV